MRTGLTFAKFARIFVACAAVAMSLASSSLADAAPAQNHQRKTKKTPAPLPPLPSGPTGPIQQVPLDSIRPVAPQVSYQNGQLTIVAPNSTLGDILRAVRKQTGAEIEVPEAQDRVVTHLGPGPARDVMSELLNGSRFNYVLLGSPQNANQLTRVVLVAKTGVETGVPANQPGPAEQQQAMMPQPGGFVAQQPPPAEVAQDANDADASDENADDNADSAEVDQPAATPDQGNVKTPQQMLQEMQQRQLQLQQQQQQTGQPPMPGRSPQAPPEQQ